MILTLRRSSIARLTATVLIVLVVLPWTAPFQTLDRSAPVGRAAAVDLCSSDKLGKDVALPADVSRVLQIACHLIEPPLNSDRLQPRRIRVSVLRL